MRPTGAEPISDSRSAPSTSADLPPAGIIAARPAASLGPATGSASHSPSVESAVSGMRASSPATSTTAVARRSREEAPTATVVVAALDHPAAEPGVPVGEVVAARCASVTSAVSPGRDLDAGERLELARRAAHRGAGQAHVHLDDLAAVPARRCW